MKQIAFFFLVFFFACIGPVPVFIVAAISYSLLYVGYELIFIAAMIDTVFGLQNGMLPYYTICTIAWLLFVTVLKTRFVAYNQ